MSAPSPIRLLRLYSVPVTVFAIVVTAIIFVPPIASGGETIGMYVMTATFGVLAVGAALPYAALVALGTLPLLAAGVASFGAPQSGADSPHTFAAGPALKHVVAGFSYVLRAAIMGMLGLGVRMGSGSVSEGIRNVILAIFPPVFPGVLTFFGGMFIAVAFVPLQLWRYEMPIAELDSRTVAGTAGLGLLISMTPAVAYRVFGWIMT